MIENENRLLILEPDPAFARRLQDALLAHGGFRLTTVSTVKEACLQLIERPYVLAFVPIENGEKIIRSLRAVQTDLRIVLMTAAAADRIHEKFAGRIQGLLIKPLLDVELPVLLRQSFTNPLVREKRDRDQRYGLASMDTADVLAVLGQARLDRLLLAVIFAQGKQILGFWGNLKEPEAAAIAQHVGRGWGKNPYPSRVQFFNLPARVSDFLLYTEQVSGAYLMTMVALPEAPLNEVRHQTRRMVKKLENVAVGKGVGSTSLLVQFKEAGSRPSFALVWRPLRRLPQPLLIPLRRAYERLAMANGCVLTHVDVRKELTHLVVTCPPGKDTSWAAYLFKSGSEQMIQQEFGVAATLWEVGFLARETSDPVSDPELRLFLQTEKKAN